MFQSSRLRCHGLLALTALLAFAPTASAQHNDGLVYQTEDRPYGLLTRFIPEQPGQLARGGRLEALALRDQPTAVMQNLDKRFKLHEPMPVTWVPLVAKPLSQERPSVDVKTMYSGAASP